MKLNSILENDKYSRFLYNLLLSVLCVFAFFAPDYILKIAGASRVKFEASFWLAFFLFGLVMSMVKNKKVVFGVVGVFFVFEAIQLHYMGYFGTPITPLEIKKIFAETNDIAESGFSYFYTVWYILPTMLMTYGLYIYFYLKYSDKCFKTKVSYVFLVLILLAKPERAYRKSLKSFLPGPTRNSIHNTLNTFSYFFVKELWNTNVQKQLQFKEYEISKMDDFEKPDVVILLVAESMNHKHLGLYGYERNTTPNLEKLKNNKNFLYRKALSSSVSTASSLPFLFNIIREPGNLKLLSNKNNNLLKLAKNNDFKTYLFTSQESKILNDLGVNFADTIATRDNNVIAFNSKKDDLLLDYLDNAIAEPSDNKFIAIFQRNLHSPYEANYEGREDEFAQYDIKQENRTDRAVNSYDNAVLYEDYFIGKIIDRIDAVSDKSVILIITADHGQMLGEDSLYGHNMLDTRVAEVPFMVYFNNKYRKVFDESEIPNNISHYEISKLVGNIIGYDVVNPNDNGEYYIQGNNIYFDNFIIPYSRGDDDELKPKKVDSSYTYFGGGVSSVGGISKLQ